MPIVDAKGTATGTGYCCGVGISATTIQYLYKQGSVVYSLLSAQIGIMEPIAIKIVKIVSNSDTFGQPVVFYVDTYNKTWNESLLVTEATAQQTAIAYLQAQRNSILSKLENCQF